MEPKKSQIKFTGDLPMEFSFKANDPQTLLPGELKDTFKMIVDTVKAYLKAAESLVSGPYSSIRNLVPPYLNNPGNVLIAWCDDGIAIRFESKTGEEKRRIGMAWGLEGGSILSTCVPLISQNLIFCAPDRTSISVDPTNGQDLALFTMDAQSKEKAEILRVKISFHAVIEKPGDLPPPPMKPYCLLSVQNSLEICMRGEVVPQGEELGSGQRFLTRTVLRLPVGWDCIEVYPFFNLESWKPEYAKQWAERDILASIVRAQCRDAELNSLDPNASARKHFSSLLNQFKELLDSNPDREEVLQQFLKDNPALLCPVQTRMWPKLALGAKKTDFIFQEATSDYLLVELERSTLPLFVKSGDPSKELNHAQRQVLDWKRYIEDNLSTVQRELGLSGISVNPKSLIVIGRSNSLSSDHRRMLVTLENNSPKLKIMTYDDVHQSAKTVIENLLGPLWDSGGSTQIYYLPKPQVLPGSV